MGSVFLAHDESLDRPVAIKVIAPEVAASADVRQRFVQESRTVARLRHPNIVQVYTSGEADGLAYFVMEYVPGESLRDRLTRDKTIPEDDAVIILREMALALDHAHAAGLVHRDVKPENVLLDRDSGRAMLTDFGVARATEGNLQLTGAGFVLGSPRYMSPEQASGETLDGRSDLYSLGLVAYEMFSGAPAVDAPTAASVLAQHLTQRVPPMLKVNPKLDKQVATAIDQLLEKDPAARHQRGAAFVAALSGETFDDSTPAAMIGRTPPPTRKSKKPSKAVWFGLAPVFIALASVLISTSGKGSDENAKEWLVAPFEVQSPDRSLDWLREGGLNMLTLSLAQWQDLRVVEYERTLDLLRDEKLDNERRIGLEDAQRLARRARAGRVVMGQLTLAGDSLIATASLYDARSGKSIDKARVAALRTADPRTVFERLAGDLLNLAGAPQLTLDLAQQTTTSVDAYRLYLDGVRQLNSWRLAQAESSFTKAIALDTTFALAYYSKSLAQGWLSKVDSSRLTDADNAVRYATRLPARQQELVRGHAELTRGFMAVAGGDASGGQAAFLASRNRLAKLVATDSLSAEAWYALADADYHLVWNTTYGRSPDSTAKYLNESLRAFQRTIALDSTFHLAFSHLVDMYGQAATPRSFLVLVGDSIKPGGPEANERRIGTVEQVAALRTAASVRGRQAAEGWIAADPDAAPARKLLAENLYRAGMSDSALKVLEAARARSTTNEPAIAWRIAALRARQLQPGVAATYAGLVDAKSSAPVQNMAINERFQALTDAITAGGITGALGITTRAAALMSQPDVLPAMLQQIPTRTIANWYLLTTRIAAGVPLSAAEKLQLADALKQINSYSPERRDRITPFLAYVSTRDTTYARQLQDIIDAQKDTVGLPEVRALWALQRGDTATAQRMVRLFPNLDSIGNRPIGLTGLRQVTRALVLMELGNARQAIAMLEAIDPARFPVAEQIETTWPVYVRQFVLRGRLYEQLGERDKAIAAYERFLALWKDADSALQPQLQDARAAMARLRDAPLTRTQPVPR